MFAARGGFLYQQPSAPPGGFGNNLLFPNDPTQYIYLNSNDDLITWKSTTGYTIEYWVYMTSWPGSINPGPGNQDGGGTNYWSFGPGDIGQLEFYYWAPGQSYFTTALNVMNLNTWYNIAAVFTTSGSDTTASLYINGVRQQIQLNGDGIFQDTITVNNGVVSSGTVFGMGRYGFGATKWNGFIDNLRVSNVNRYSGASYTLATGPFTYDSNTQILIEPTGTVGSSTIAYQSASGNGNMTNASNIVTIVNSHANHT